VSPTFREDRNRYDWTKENQVKVGTKTQERRIIIEKELEKNREED
jgi:hypothetical protein